MTQRAFRAIELQKLWSAGFGGNSWSNFGKVWLSCLTGKASVLASEISFSQAGVVFSPASRGAESGGVVPAQNSVFLPVCLHQWISLVLA